MKNRGGAETEKIEDGAQEVTNTFGQFILVVSYNVVAFIIFILMLIKLIEIDVDNAK